MNKENPYKSDYRPEIDGLRAFAILSVVVFHAFPSWITGGFIGVDVFFVISGFLITSHIFERLDEGRFSFSDFFGRRIRRIFPALVIVMAISMVFGWYVLLQDEYAQLGNHVFGGTTFISNFFYWKESMGYLTNNNDAKPMLHLWSLAVEEQFYILWPLVLWIAWKRKFNLFILTFIVALFSFYLNIKFVGSHPIATFFWPFGRFWELLSGSLLAWLFLHKERYLDKSILWIDNILARTFQGKEVSFNRAFFANLASLLGLSILLYGVLKINDGLEYPGEWALIPILGTLLIISAGSQAWVNRIFLTNPVSIWFGLISYPLYLWHWPILSFLHITEGQGLQREIRLSAIALAIILAWLTYKLIETPFRRKMKPFISIVILVSLLASIGVFGLFVKINDGIPQRISNIKGSEYALTQIGSAGKIKETKLCRDYFVGFDKGLCVLEKDAPPTVLLFGDSHALQLYEGLKLSLQNEVVAMIGGGFGGKYESALDPFINNDRTLSKEAYRVIKNLSSIHTIVLAHNNYKNNYQFVETFDYFKGLGLNVVYIIDGPKVKNPANCYIIRPYQVGNKEVSDCPTNRIDALDQMRDYRINAYNALSKSSFVKAFDLAELLCDSRNCFSKIDNKLLYSNGGSNSHFSIDGSIYAGKALGEFLRTQKVTK